jgi:hypothetical protein
MNNTKENVKLFLRKYDIEKLKNIDDFIDILYSYGCSIENEYSTCYLTIQ